MTTALNLPALLRPLVLATLALTFAGFAAARDNADDGQRPDGPPSTAQMLEHMQQNLGLNDSQSSQVKQILEQERAKHEAAHKDAQQAMSKILTKEQQQKMQNRPPRGQQGDRQAGNGRPGEGGRDGNSNGNNGNRGDRGGRDNRSGDNSNGRDNSRDNGRDNNRGWQ
ncbi:MAG: hypothetical protein PSX71_06765 [bacterium]|nr:hypothetical protein [bacterium]